MNKEKLLRDAFAKALTPPPDLTISDWADAKRILPKKSSSEHGPWRTSRFPYHEEIMFELSPQSTANEVTVMKGAQVGCTELAINRILYNMDINPKPHLYIQKTVENVRRFSQQRLAPSIKAIPELNSKMGNQMGRDSSDTILLKSYAGGILIMGGANSASSLRSMPISDLDLDEWDSYEQDIQAEGSPAELAIRRTANFPRHKIFYLSTPLIKETSKIEPKFESGDQRRYLVKCPFCGNFDYIRWENIKYSKKPPHNPKLLCVNCGILIEEKYKTEMMSKENGAHWKAFNPNGDHPSFHLSGLYSPLGFYSWNDAVKMWIKAQKNLDKELLKVFINTVLGETFSESGKTMEASGIAQRCENYINDVPAKGLVLTCGVDVQANRIEYEVVAWGKGGENWSIEYRVLMGDTEQQEIWLELDKYLAKIYINEKGHQMNIAMTFVDCGYLTSIVHAFCKYREHRNIYPVNGASGWGKGLVKRPTRKHENGVYVFTAFVDELKMKLYQQLQIENPGPGYCHFPTRPEYDSQYFKMLVAERLDRRIIKGFTKLEWVLPKGRRNEALDCRNYNRAAITVLNPDYDVIAGSEGMVVNTKHLIKRKIKQHSKGVR